MSDSYAYASFLTEHRPQLVHFKVPTSLWSSVYAKLVDETFDAGTSLVLVAVNGTENEEKERVELDSEKKDFLEVKSESELEDLAEKECLNETNESLVKKMEASSSNVDHISSKNVCVAGKEYCENEAESNSDSSHHSAANLIPTKYVLRTFRPLKKESVVFLIDHSWTFHSKKDAREQLLALDSLRNRMVELMGLQIESLENLEVQKNLAVEGILDKLYEYGWQFEFVGSDPKGENEAPETSVQKNPYQLSSFDRKIYYYVLDEVGSRFLQSENPTFEIVPFFYGPQQIAYSLCWPVRDLEEGETCSIIPRIPLNDFSRMDYWDKRYQVESEAYEFDWYLGYDTIKDFLTQPRRVDSVEFPAILSKSSKILVPGCGNSPFCMKFKQLFCYCSCCHVS